jgi:hypothetical protein
VAIAIVFLVLGFILGLMGSLMLFYSQFRRSIAGYRVNMVVKATRDITKEQLRVNPYTSFFCDKYRFSLGVIIDAFTNPAFACSREFLKGQASRRGPWPRLIDSVETDRWQRFADHVRPVIDDINTYTFLGFIGPAIPSLARLKALSDLCREIENVVGSLDGGCEAGIVEIDSEGQIVPIAVERLIGVDEQSRERLRRGQDGIYEDYAKLARAWERWYACCNVL